MNTKLQKPIGIFGGTFDPIHFGHLRTAIEIQQEFNLAEVRLVPCYQPVHRHMPIASAQHRLQMLTHAIEAEPALAIEDCEMQRRGPSYTIDTLTFLQQKFPHTPLCLILGIDAFLDFASWHRWQEILQKAHLIVVKRAHYQLPESGTIAELLQQRLTDHTDAITHEIAGKIMFFQGTTLEISASEIRKQFSQHQNPRYLLPNIVYRYIQEHGIYVSNPII